MNDSGPKTDPCGTPSFFPGGKRTICFNSLPWQFIEFTERSGLKAFYQKPLLTVFNSYSAQAYYPIIIQSNYQLQVTSHSKKILDSRSDIIVCNFFDMKAFKQKYDQFSIYLARRIATDERCTNRTVSHEY